MSYLTKTLASTLVAAALAGCASIPPPLSGNDFAALTPQQAAGQTGSGQRVRWGGEILNVEPRANATCFEILARALYADARPDSGDYSEGRFIACKSGFFDPYVYTQGRDVTVVGTVGGSERHKVGEFNYTFAMVDATQIYLWPERDYYADDFTMAPAWSYGWNGCFDPLWVYPCYGWGWGGFGYFGGYYRHHYHGGGPHHGWSGRGGSSGHAGGFHAGGFHGGAHGH